MRDNAVVTFSWSSFLGFAALGAALASLAAFLGGVRATPSVLAVLVLACAACSLTAFTRRALLLALSVLAALLALALLTPILRPALHALVRSEAPVRADAIVVLGAGENCADATLNAAGMARLVRGLELWRAGFAEVMTVSEPSGVFKGPSCPLQSDLARRHVRALYPSGGPTIEVLRRVTTTRDEAARVADLARANAWTRVLLVTSPSHSRRAAATFEAAGVNVVSVTASEPLFDSALALPSDRLTALGVVVYEGLSRLKAALGGE